MQKIQTLEEEILQAIKKGGDGGTDLQIIQDQCGLGSPAQVVSCLKQLCAAGKVVKHGARHYMLANNWVKPKQYDDDDDLAFANNIAGQVKRIADQVKKADKEQGDIIQAAKAPAIIERSRVDVELDELARKLEFQAGVNSIELKKSVLERLSAILAGDIADVLHDISGDLERLHG